MSLVNDADGVQQAPPSRPWRRLDDAARRAWAKALVEAGGVEVDRRNEAISVSGPCPACGHDFQATLVDRDILAGLADASPTELRGPLGGVDWGRPIRFEVFCYCTADHDGRPSDVSHGCGAAGWLRDTADV